MFASQQTSEPLHVTFLSALDIIGLLHQKEVLYVLAAKLNQDPLQVSGSSIFFFSCISDSFDQILKLCILFAAFLWSREELWWR